jgi:hypothetical protein
MGVIELRPQLSISPQEQLRAGQPFSTPFEITNTGYLNVHVKDVIVIVHRVEFGNRVAMTNESLSSADWDDFELIRGSSKTIFARYVNGRPTRTDIVFAVDYKFLWKTWRWFFRFQGDYVDNWHWSKQPLGNLEIEMNKIADDAVTHHFQFLNTHVPN